jgi:hypothetical protein
MLWQADNQLQVNTSDQLYSKSWLIQNSRDHKKFFLIVKNLYNSN